MGCHSSVQVAQQVVGFFPFAALIDNEGEKGLDEVSGVGMEVIRVTADALPLDGQRDRNGTFGE